MIGQPVVRLKKINAKYYILKFFKGEDPEYTLLRNTQWGLSISQVLPNVRTSPCLERWINGYEPWV